MLWPAQKFGMAFFSPTIFWGFDFCPIRSSLSLIRSTLPRGRTIRKVMGAGGWGGEFSACTNFFFSLTACAGIFFSGEPLCTNFFFQTNIAFFWTVKSWFIIYVFVLYKLFYTHNRSKNTGHFNAKSFRKCAHSERGGSHLEWTASEYIFSVPALWNSSPTAHHNDASEK